MSVTFEKCLQVEQEKTGSDRERESQIQMRVCLYREMRAEKRAESPLIIIRWKTAIKIIYMLQRIGQAVAKSCQQQLPLPFAHFLPLIW